MDGCTSGRVALVFAGVLWVAAAGAIGQEVTPADPQFPGPGSGEVDPWYLPAVEDAPADPPAEENPYAGDLLTRTHGLGDPLGMRSRLADRGLTFDVYATQFYQGVVQGGRVRDWEYGGKLDYLFNVDGGKLGLWQGLLVNLHAETRYGTDVNNIDGLLAPSNIAMNFPEPNRNITSITGLKVTQALSENFVVYLGKINTLDEYVIRFSDELGLGRPGLGGFQNTSLVFNPILARTVPYSAAGVGGAFLREGQPLFTFTVFDPEERAAKALEDLYARGVVLVPDLVLRGKPFGRPGLYNFGGTYSNARYRSFDPAAYLEIPPELVRDEQFAPKETGSWSLYANFYQAVWVDPYDEKRTWGVFGQFGLSDGNPNPIRFVANSGIAGRSMLPRRRLDTFGVGYFYLGLSDQFKALAGPFLPQQDEYGVELFYNYAVTPWCRLTYDLQVARPSTQGLDTAIITGLRLQLRF
jgi:porin